MRKMYSKKQIEEIAKSSGGKVYLHNIGLAGNITGSIKLYTTNNEPFTKETLTSFMANNGITDREKGFPVCCNSAIANADNVAKILLFNFVVYVASSYLVVSNERLTFNIVESNVTLTKNIDPYKYVSAITDTVIEL